ncbi:MerC domain-containing protein [Microscilla marina]|uniref:MerC domain-containing protein n=1 Tax=Microscilla marina ATCC 23134 TaxID=313606 RepID=A1ZCW0_MICM2|nr:MerC domain-containing protein [Microscilla marina]EAY31499.1 hypothetical protein M23134_05005 [Microscilla marina ATCC 23134]
MRNNLFKKADTLGIISSFLCLIHCISLPILVSIQPVVGKFIDEELHFLEYVFVGLSLIAVYFATRSSHVTLRMKWAFYIIFVLFTLGIFLEDAFVWLTYLAYAGSVGLIVMHIINIRHSMRCSVPEHAH